MSLTLATDGSAHKDNLNHQGLIPEVQEALAAREEQGTSHARTSAGWAVWNHHQPSPPVKQGKRGCGRATVFDAELSALTNGVRALTDEYNTWATSYNGKKALKRDNYHFTLNVFVDSIAAGLAVLKGDCWGGQMHLIRVQTALKKFLLAHGRHKIRIVWVPSHVQDRREMDSWPTRFNDAVDKLAREAARSNSGHPKHGSSYAAAQADTKVKAKKVWQGMMNGIKYRGHSNLLKQTEHKLIVPNSKHYSLRHFGHDHRLYVRMTRFLTGHFPHGEFRDKMHLDGSRKCTCADVYESRDHILYKCPYWIRPQGIKPPKRASDRTRMELISAGKQLKLQNKEQQVSIDDIHEFLLINPLVGTFEWQDLMEHLRSEVFPERERDASGWQSHLTHLVFDALVLQRPALYTEYRRETCKMRTPPAFLQWISSGK